MAPFAVRGGEWGFTGGDGGWGWSEQRWPYLAIGNAAVSGDRRHKGGCSGGGQGRGDIEGVLGVLSHGQLGRRVERTGLHLFGLGKIKGQSLRLRGLSLNRVQGEVVRVGWSRNMRRRRRRRSGRCATKAGVTGSIE